MTKLHSKGSLRGLHKSFPNIFEYKAIPSKASMIFDITIKGNKEGNTLLKKSSAPSIAPLMHISGNITICNISMEANIIMIIFLLFISFASTIIKKNTRKNNNKIKTITPKYNCSI